MLRAFYNVCRHRAGNVAAGKGNRKSLQCRYHGWTYALDGRLLTTPEFEGVAGLRQELLRPAPGAGRNLGAVRLRQSGPRRRPARRPRSASSWRRRRTFRWPAMRPVERRDYVIDCNWKVYIDNYLEGYHLPIAHPGLYRELDYENYRVETHRYHSRQLAPLRPVAGSGAGRRYAEVQPDEEVLYYWVFPNFMVNIYPDNMSSNIILPLGHDKTLTIFEWYFHEQRRRRSLGRRAAGGGLQRRDPAGGHRHLRERAARPGLARLRPGPLLGQARERRASLPLARI